MVDTRRGSMLTTNVTGLGQCVAVLVQIAMLHGAADRLGCCLGSVGNASSRYGPSKKVNMTRRAYGLAAGRPPGPRVRGGSGCRRRPRGRGAKPAGLSASCTAPPTARVVVGAVLAGDAGGHLPVAAPGAPCAGSRESGRRVSVRLGRGADYWGRSAARRDLPTPPPPMTPRRC